MILRNLEKGVWIKKPDFPLKNSLDDYLNFLYNSGKVYIMDNHLAAGWSWLNSLNVAEQYNLFHIDRHYDLLEFPLTMNTEVIDKGIKLGDLTLLQYLDIKQDLKNNGSVPAFRWDNYIGNLNVVYPNLFKEKFFATQRDGTPLRDFINHEMDCFELINNIEYWITETNECNWIVNLDIDYFFTRVGDQNIQTLSDEYIIELMNRLKKVYDRIVVITISLSPECSGGWRKAIEKCMLICDVLEVDFELG